MPKLLIRRKTGYLSSYSLSMFYGAWAAGHYFKNGPHHAAFVRIGTRTVRIPDRMMIVFKPFNRYTTTLRGERFVR